MISTMDPKLLSFLTFALLTAGFAASTPVNAAEDCSKFTDPTTCNQNLACGWYGGCKWEPVIPNGNEYCPTIKDETTCNASMGVCVWNYDNGCVQGMKQTCDVSCQAHRPGLCYCTEQSFHGQPTVPKSWIMRYEKTNELEPSPCNICYFNTQAGCETKIDELVTKNLCRRSSY